MDVDAEDEELADFLVDGEAREGDGACGGEEGGERGGLGDCGCKEVFKEGGLLGGLLEFSFSKREEKGKLKDYLDALGQGMADSEFGHVILLLP